MRSRFAIILLLAVLAAGGANAQLRPGFDPAEARDLSALCATHTFKELYGDDAEMIPDGYQRVYESPVMGMDNKFQLFRKGDAAVLEIRGSTSSAISWMENIQAAMIPAQGVIRIDGRPFPYRFASDTAASVHAGYALGIACIANDAVARIRQLTENGVRDLIITGHSQGGALALLLRAYLHHLPSSATGATLRIKAYAFAHPMVGNRAFMDEFTETHASGLGCFSLVNPADPVPRMPLAYDDGRLVSSDRVFAVITGQEPLDPMGRVRSAAIKMLRRPITGITAYLSGSVEKRIAGSVGEVELPPYRSEINYAPMKGRMDLEPFAYPVCLKDSSCLRNDSIMRVEPRDANGHFTNPELYRKEPTFYQHKPYNYHVAVLRRWFPKDFEAIRMKWLPENL
ncbi:MAG: hypothetical protein IPF41_10485 [Flavobacteriales bacterium]|nr:hypothetical protein [Flavobacteriales bacterium]